MYTSLISHRGIPYQFHSFTHTHIRIHKLHTISICNVASTFANEVKANSCAYILGFYLKWSSLNTSYHIYSALSLIWSEGISFVRAATNDDTNGKYKHVEPDKLIFIIVSIAFNLFVVIRCILEKLLQVVALRIIEMFSRLPESTQLSCSVWLPRRKSWINRRNETFPARISARFMQLIGYFFGIYSISVTLTSVHLFFNKLVDCIFQWNS